MFDSPRLLHAKAQQMRTKESFLRRAIRKLTVYGYRFIAPLRGHEMALERIFPAYAALPQNQPKPLKVLLVVPFKDKATLTKVCFEGLLAQERSGLELCIALVDNNSNEVATSQWLQSLRDHPPAGVTLRILSYQQPFNFSYLNNQAVKDCQDFEPDVLGFINNDIEFTAPATINKLARLCGDAPQVGAVGCTLIYPDRRIQHLFVYVGSKIVGSHPGRGQLLREDDPWFQAVRMVPAVTGAVLFIKHIDFVAVEGFDEELATSYQDVDLCMKLQKRGLTNLCAADQVNIHHETQTRSKEPNHGEAAYIYAKWGDYLRLNPGIPPIYSRLSEDLVPGFNWTERLFQFFPERKSELSKN